MRWRSRGGAGLTALALTVSLGNAPPAAAQPAAQPGAPAAGTHRLTLVTGDQVFVTDHAGGSPTIRLRKAKGREHVQFTFRSSNDGDLHVEPQDAVKLIAQGRLDERLFDITLLTRDGYDDAGRKDIPVLAERAEAGHQASLAGTTAKTSLPTLGIDALKVDKAKAGATWASLTGNVGAKSLGGGVGKLWLDGKRKALLDESVPQIGAPKAWKNGLTGKNTTVAVLDTGYDAEHPDLKDVVVKAQGFTDKGPADVADKAGHGTHVSSIVAGSAAASNGRYKGVAPDAKIAMGKVLDDHGYGLDSWILAGMEWAATKTGARVINVSLGGGDMQTLDPLEKAVGTLTTKTGALFVISAGNAGETRTIGSPGSADAALTVGAVDKQDRLADFSSRGPRVGDFAVKPDVTAPGVNITAAMAKGTGWPEDAKYISESGTSMAAPHVAGAAAILAQQHPDWKAGQLKAALIGSAKPGKVGVFEQGAGRIDVARATTTPVVASEGNISAYLRYPAHKTVVRDVTYTNLTDAPVALKLAAPKGPFRLSTTSLNLPAKGRATVRLTISAKGVKAGSYSGVLTATGTNVAVRTVLGGYVEPKVHQLTIKAIDQAGEATDAAFWAVRLDKPHEEWVFAPGGTGQARLPAGDWNLLTDIFTWDAHNNITQATMVIPARLNGDKKVVFDARKAKKIKTTIDEPTARVQSGIWMGLIHDNGRTRYTYGGMQLADEKQLYITPIRQKSLAFFEQTTWLKKGSTADKPSPYRYDLVNWQTGGVRADPTYRAKKAKLTKITGTYRAQNATMTGSVMAGPVIPIGGGKTMMQWVGWDMRLPLTIAHYLTADPHITWSRGVYVNTDYYEGHWILGPNHKLPKKTTRTEVWGAAAFSPGFVKKSAVRSGDTITHLIARAFSDPAAGRIGEDYGTKGTTTLSSGGKVLGASDVYPGTLTVKAPAATATYTIKQSLTRTHSTLSSKVETTWTYRSGHTSREQPLPLKVVRLAPAKLDGQNRAKAGSKTDIAVRVDTNPGVIDISAKPKAPVIEVSFDDGVTWKKLTVKAAGKNWTTQVTNPGTGFVSLRATIPGAVTQTVVHAYAIGG